MFLKDNIQQAIQPMCRTIHKQLQVEILVPLRSSYRIVFDIEMRIGWNIVY